MEVSSFRQWPWFFKGMRGIISAPALVLMGAFVGFCGFAYESGIPLSQTVFMTAIVWALPAQLVLVGAMLAGASLPAAAIAVTLSSMRLMPMVAAFVPEIRTKSTPTWLLLVLSHFVAVTAWVFTMERLHLVPREGRLAFFAGFALTLTSANIVLVATLYSVVSYLPALLVGALFFLTPIYFLTSIWSSARSLSGADCRSCSGPRLSFFQCRFGTALCRSCRWNNRLRAGKADQQVAKGQGGSMTLYCFVMCECCPRICA